MGALTQTCISEGPRQSAVLTGPLAAAHLQWDGFRDIAWPRRWTAPATVRPHPEVVRTRNWLAPMHVDGLLLAHPILILRHLGNDVSGFPDDPKISHLERIELAVEHALRTGMDLTDLRRSSVWKGRTPGDQMLASVLVERGFEPPAESFAETRQIQRLRDWGYYCWRQVPIYERGQVKHRVDVVVPFDQPRARIWRPQQVLPADGLVLEVDSREFHHNRFEEDHARETTYDLLGYSWMSFTPNQLEHSPARARAAFERRFEQAKRNTQTAKRNTQARKVA